MSSSNIEKRPAETNDTNNTNKYKAKITTKIQIYNWICIYWGGSHGVMARVLDCGLEQIEFELQLCYYVHFQTNDPWERHESSYPLAMG